MNNPELFDRSIKALVNAYQNDQLDPLDCAACAVGNIIAASNGYKLVYTTSSKYLFVKGFNWIDQNGNIQEPEWGSFFKSNDTENISLRTIQEVENTEYSIEELRQIEDAFLYQLYQADGTEENFNSFLGLMDVVDCLMRIHGASQDEVDQAKRQFVKF